MILMPARPRPESRRRRRRHLRLPPAKGPLLRLDLSSRPTRRFGETPSHGGDPSTAQPPSTTNQRRPCVRNRPEPAYLTALQVAELPQVEDEKTVLRWSLQEPSMPVLRRGRVGRFPRERL
jgi:hypothetical protein